MSTNNDISIYWIRNDLRISDNLALLKSSEFNNVIPIFILDNVNSQAVSYTHLTLPTNREV